MLKCTHPMLSGFVSALILLSALSLLAPVRSAGQSAPVPPAESPAPPLVTPPPQELANFMQKGAASVNKEAYPAAEEAFKMGLEKARSLHNAYYEGRFLNALGMVCVNMKCFKEAQDFFKQSYNIRKNLPGKADLAWTTVNLSRANSELGETPEALNYAAEALNIISYLTEKKDLLSCWAYLSEVFQKAKLPLKEIDCYNRMIRILMDGKEKTSADKIHLVDLLHFIGNAYYNMGQFSAAAVSYERALAANAAVGDKKRDGSLLVNIGDAYNKAGQPKLSAPA